MLDEFIQEGDCYLTFRNKSLTQRPNETYFFFGLRVLESISSQIEPQFLGRKGADLARLAEGGEKGGERARESKGGAERARESREREWEREGEEERKGLKGAVRKVQRHRKKGSPLQNRE